MYDKGQGVPQNYAEAVKWYRLAADRASHRAVQSRPHVLQWPGRAAGLRRGAEVVSPRCRPGRRRRAEQPRRHVRKGQGVPQDYAEAVKWYRLAADQGNASAQNNLGFMYERPGRAAGLRRGAEVVSPRGGPGIAWRRTISAYVRQGQGVPQDEAEAVKWFRLAADQGDAPAQLNLGTIYANGEGVPQDYPEALKRYRLAADQGLPYAQFNLGNMYNDGRGVPQDYVRAHTCGSTCRPRGADRGAAKNRDSHCSAHAPRADRGSPEAGA